MDCEASSEMKRTQSARKEPEKIIKKTLRSSGFLAVIDRRKGLKMDWQLDRIGNSGRLFHKTDILLYTSLDALYLSRRGAFVYSTFAFPKVFGKTRWRMFKKCLLS